MNVIIAHYILKLYFLILNKLILYSWLLNVLSLILSVPYVVFACHENYKQDNVKIRSKNTQNTTRYSLIL